jgi:hypothetical protein
MSPPAPELAKPHWVSRCLTEPWEVRDKDKRMLHFFDLAKKKVEKPISSLKLFREERGRLRELEARLNELVETPIMQAREKLLAPGQVELLDLKTARAIALLLFMQAQRDRARVTQSDDALATLLLMDDDQIATPSTIGSCIAVLSIAPSLAPVSSCARTSRSLERNSHNPKRAHTPS